MSRWSADDLHRFNEGTHARLYEKLGAYPGSSGGKEGTWFSVWAPNARSVAVMGGFNAWNRESHPLACLGNSGVWEGFVPGVHPGDLYKYHVASRQNDHREDKADPFAFRAEVSPRTASVVWDLEYAWNDARWMGGRSARSSPGAPMTVYEVHLGSWMRAPEEGNRSLTYRELAPKLAEHARAMGFTHVELMPVMEHPFYGSWGYQVTGYFAATSRYGTPQDLMFLIDTLHQAGIGVILDWVPSHFPSDAHGLAYFDGTHLYEHADPREGFHPDWNSLVFNYGRNEVRAFLISNALFWLDRYHADALRVDAVASMLYRDYSRKPGEWIPNRHGGRENEEAIAFLRRLNEEVYARFPGAQTIAEESTAWAGVSRPTRSGGLGFGYKWDMGWMHDTLEYFRHEPIHRKFHHAELAFRMVYAFHENFVLSLSHDEVVHGKGSMLGRMPGDDWRKFANLRLLLGYQYAQPGKKLLFMGMEFGQRDEWSHERSLDWHLLEQAPHAGIRRWVRDLNRLIREEPALHALDCDPVGFEWIDWSDADSGVVLFLRRAPSAGKPVLAAFNFTPVPRGGYRAGVPAGGAWTELLNSDAADYGGSGLGNSGRVQAQAVPFHGRPFSVELTLPPLAVVLLRGEEGA